MKRVPSLAALAALLLTAAACGDDTTSSSDGTVPPTTTVADVPDTVPGAALPSRIVSLSPTATEMLFAIDAGDLVIAVDDYSNYPAEALQKPHDLSGFEPNVESIAALNPDLVLMQDAKVKDQLEALGITVWVGPAAATFDDVYTQIEQLGAATGHVGDAAELVSHMQADIAAAVAKVSADTPAFTYYHELDPTFFSLTSNTFAGQVYNLFSLKNIADGAQAGNDYPQLNAEYIISANPTIIFLADTKCCSESAPSVAARPGWDAIDAVKSGSIVAIDDDIASRWGPRIVQYVQTVADALAKILAPA